ncbi:MAG: NAD(+) diphosphatase [Selenomonadaceae bacterium]|nr:NAD(+) diphosphatase [Selenomonadaceae bacterium]
MIQDIRPHQLKNEFIVNVKPDLEDFIIYIEDDKFLVGGKEGAMLFPRFKEFNDDFEHIIYLFSIEEQKFFLITDKINNTLVDYKFMSLKDIRSQMKAPLTMMFAAYTAWHLALWYRDNQFCGRCGNKTKHSETERAVICNSCGHIIYPKIMPAVIVGVTNGNQLLLTKYAHRNLPYYALIAGFVEIGETVEECVQREVMEEVGLKVKNIRYYKSQPWGVVQDLLMGFFCEVDGDTTIKLERNELKEAVWTAREDIIGQSDDWSLTHNMMMKFKEENNM